MVLERKGPEARTIEDSFLYVAIVKATFARVCHVPCLMVEHAVYQILPKAVLVAQGAPSSHVVLLV